MKRGQSVPLGKQTLRIIARLHHLHLLTHPSRVALTFNITPEYVRRQFREQETWEMAGILESLAAIGLNTQHRLAPSVPTCAAHETHQQSTAGHPHPGICGTEPTEVSDRESEPREKCPCTCE